MRAKLSDELKQAISKMSAAEKDKLLFRLIVKDKLLTEQLTFQLLEGGNTAEERSDNLRASLIEKFPKTGTPYLTPGWILMDLRFWNARITEYAKTTKNKANEVSLVVFMLAEMFRRHFDFLKSLPDKRSYSLAPYIVKRVQSLLPKAAKLHEDYRIDFEADLQYVFDCIWAFKPTQIHATENKLPKKFDC